MKARVCVAACNFGGTTGFTLQGTFRTLGPVAYARQTQAGVDVGNDFGLVEIPNNLLPELRPSLPVWGGPVTATQANANGPVCLYGNGLLVGETFPTMARAGQGLSTSPTTGRWEALLPINSGDSGSALVTCGPEPDDGIGLHGNAPVGIVTHGIGFAGIGIPGIGDGTTVNKAIAMATQAGLAIELVTA